MRVEGLGVRGCMCRPASQLLILSHLGCFNTTHAPHLNRTSHHHNNLDPGIMPSVNLTRCAAGDLYDKDEMISTADPFRSAGVSAGLADASVMATPLGDGQTFDVATSAR
eukprot:764785-Rhodomonas_salina.1